MTITKKVYIDLSDEGAPGWVDISSDVLNDGLRFEYGILANSVADRTAGTGLMSLILDNVNRKYSPNSTDCLDGFEIGNRLKIVFDDGTNPGSDYALSYDGAYSDSLFGDGLVHASSTDRSLKGLYEKYTSNGDASTNFIYEGGDLSVSVWIRPSSDEDWALDTDNGISSDFPYATLFSYEAGDPATTNSRQCFLRGYSGQIVKAVMSWGSDTITHDIPTAGTDWVHVCFAANDGTEMTIYVNGSEGVDGVCQDLLASDNAVDKLAVFSDTDYGGQSLIASIAHICIWNRELSEAEAFALYSNREFQEERAYTLPDGTPDYYWALASTGKECLVTDEAGVYTKFSGRIQDIRPRSDRAGNRQTEITVADWMDRALNYPSEAIPIQVDQLAGTVVQRLLEYSNAYPRAVDIDTGVNEFTYAFNSAQEESSLLSELNKLARSEPGFVVVHGGATSDGRVGETFRFLDRAAAQQITTIGLVLDDGGDSDAMTSLEVFRSEAQLANKVKVVVHPVEVDAGLAQIYEMDDATPPEIPPGGYLYLTVTYQDSDSSFETIGAVDVVIPERNVDYTIESAAVGGVDSSLDIREQIKDTLSSNLIGYWPLFDTGIVTVVEEVVPNSGGSGGGGGGDDDDVSTSGGTVVTSTTYVVVHAPGAGPIPW